MSLCRNWNSPNPSPACECALPPEPKGGGGHTRLRLKGWGIPNSDDWRKSLAICLLCGQYNEKKREKIFLICKEIQKGAVAKSYMTYGLLIYD